ncbi:MAG: prolyl oligopeptidase family serine peptidase [Polyangiaceae bacterium]|nr:prolyl oligopeptidase family serine peptidase [Polyangiaceae bacterium]
MRRQARLLFAAILVAGCSSPAPALVSAPAPRPAERAPITSDMVAVPVKKGPPVAPVRDVRDVYFGKEVFDPYRWMETDSDEYTTWMKGQADFARSAIDELGTRNAWFDRITALDNAAARVRGVVRRGGMVFSLEAEPGQDIYAVYVRTNLDAPKRMLIDPTKFVTDGKTVAIDYWVPSPSGSLVAFGISQSGSEMAVLHVIETKTGKVLPDVIDRARYAGPSWLDEKSFFYKRDRKLPADAPATERFTKARVYHHVLGTDPEKDVALFGHGVVAGIDVGDEAFPNVGVYEGSPYAFATLYHGVQPDMTLYVAPKKSLAGAKTPWKKVFDPRDEVTDFDAKGNHLYLITHKNAPRSKLLRIDLGKPDLAKAETIIAESEAIIKGTGLAKEALYVRKLEAGIGKLYRVPFDTNKPEPVETGLAGTVAGLSTNENIPGALVRIEAWTASPKLVAFDPAKKKADPTNIIPPSPVVFESIVATEVKAKSADGTTVPLSIIHRRDLSRDGTNPTYLNGYASYGNVYGPYFEPTDFAWLERGHIMAVCHARGGGEYGEDWHRGGKLATKINTVLDFIACAEYLVQEKYTSPAHLAGQGTSAGGILIGGAVVRRPDLFGAAVMRVGMVNALRFEQIPIGPFNTSEFGTVATKEGFDMLWNIDAYHAVVKGKAYPAVLLTTGITDPRVSPWQMAKMAARLQASTSSDKPVLLRVDFGSGHGIGTTKKQRAEELADTYAFLEWQIGKK